MLQQHAKRQPVFGLRSYAAVSGCCHRWPRNESRREVRRLSRDVAAMTMPASLWSSDHHRGHCSAALGRCRDGQLVAKQRADAARSGRA